MSNMPTHDPDGNKYPQFPKLRNFKKMKKVPMCIMCEWGGIEKHATFTAEFATSWFRGEDETYFLCSDHKPQQLRHALVEKQREFRKSVQEDSASSSSA